MALSSITSSPAGNRLRRFSPINPLPAVFFHRAHSSTHLKKFVSTSRDRNGPAPRISHVCAISDSASTEEMNPPSSRIFVKGLSRSTSEGYLLKQFSQFGEISKVKILTSRGSKESLGMAYIWFSCTESTQLAIKEMNGKFVDGRFIAVMMSRPEAPTKHVKFMPYSLIMDRANTWVDSSKNEMVHEMEACGGHKDYEVQTLQADCNIVSGVKN